jgi:hypothetical protein
LTDSLKLAHADFTQAIKLEPKASDALAGRGLAFVLLGQVHKGIDDATLALRFGPGSSRLSYNVARIYAQSSLRAERRTGKDSRDEYSRQAVEMLADALERLPPKQRAELWHSRVLADPVLHPVRGSTGFQRLGARFARQTVHDSGKSL